MQIGILTTTLSELNRLFWMYVEATAASPTKAHKTWIEYEAYARRYLGERGFKVGLEPRRLRS
jgi:hypothetical protein